MSGFRDFFRNVLLFKQKPNETPGLQPPKDWPQATGQSVGHRVNTPKASTGYTGEVDNAPFGPPFKGKDYDYKQTRRVCPSTKAAFEDHDEHVRPLQPIGKVKQLNSVPRETKRSTKNGSEDEGRKSGVQTSEYYEYGILGSYSQRTFDEENFIGSLYSANQPEPSTDDTASSVESGGGEFGGGGAGGEYYADDCNIDTTTSSD